MVAMVTTVTEDGTAGTNTECNVHTEYSYQLLHTGCPMLLVKVVGGVCILKGIPADTTISNLYFYLRLIISKAQCSLQ